MLEGLKDELKKKEEELRAKAKELLDEADDYRRAQRRKYGVAYWMMLAIGLILGMGLMSVLANSCDMFR
jgi:ElaB/YqjD/DUF883 family membrane-anchored ribosome-binding protein